MTLASAAADLDHGRSPVPGETSGPAVPWELFALIPLATLVVDVEGRVLAKTAVAKAMLASNPALRVAGGMLRCTSSERHRALMQTLRYECGPGGAPLCRTPRVVPLGPEGVCALVVASPGLEGLASVVLLDPHAPTRRVDAGLLRFLYGLTTAEAKVTTYLVQGLTPDKICAAMGIPAETAHVHLWNVLGTPFRFGAADVRTDARSPSGIFETGTRDEPDICAQA
jgi:hypothetical protein